MSQPIYRTPPIAGRPPYATDEPDSVYQQQPAPTRRIRQQPPPDPNARSSAYNMYDQYLDGADPSQNPFDDSKKARTRPSSPGTPAPPYQAIAPQQHSIPIAAPKPGYAAPVAALNLARPNRAATPEGRQPSPNGEMSQAFPKPLTLVSRQNSPASPHFPQAPHELQPPITPIIPAFIRPSSAMSSPRDDQFTPAHSILRGDKEETLLLHKGQSGGGDFWRRFSVVAKEDKKYQSQWLKKTMSGGSRFSRWVWLTGIVLLIIICVGTSLGAYKSQKDSGDDSSVVTAIGGSAEETNSAADIAIEDSTALSSRSLDPETEADALFEQVLPSSSSLEELPGDFVDPDSPGVAKARALVRESSHHAHALHAYDRRHRRHYDHDGRSVHSDAHMYNRHQRSHVNRTLN